MPQGPADALVFLLIWWPAPAATAGTLTANASKMNIIRQIDIFDNQTDKLVKEIPMESFDLDIFRKRFSFKKGDSLMYDPYEITSSTIDLFPNIKFEFDKYSYYVACYQTEV